MDPDLHPRAPNGPQEAGFSIRAVATNGPRSPPSGLHPVPSERMLEPQRGVSDECSSTGNMLCDLG